MEINYKDLIDLGFKRIECKDEIFFNKYGFKYFFLSYNNGSIGFNWGAITREVAMYINNIYYKNVNLEELKKIINLLESKKVYEDFIMA